MQLSSKQEDPSATSAWAASALPVVPISEEIPPSAPTVSNPVPEQPKVEEESETEEMPEPEYRGEMAAKPAVDESGHTIPVLSDLGCSEGGNATGSEPVEMVKVEIDDTPVTEEQPLFPVPEQSEQKPQPVVAENPQPVAAEKPQPVAEKPQPVAEKPQPVAEKPQPQTPATPLPHAKPQYPVEDKPRQPVLRKPQIPPTAATSPLQSAPVLPVGTLPKDSSLTDPVPPTVVIHPVSATASPSFSPSPSPSSPVFIKAPIDSGFIPGVPSNTAPTSGPGMGEPELKPRTVDGSDPSSLVDPFLERERLEETWREEMKPHSLPPPKHQIRHVETPTPTAIPTATPTSTVDPAWVAQPEPLTSEAPCERPAHSAEMPENSSAHQAARAALTTFEKPMSLPVGGEWMAPPASILSLAPETRDTMSPDDFQVYGLIHSGVRHTYDAVMHPSMELDEIDKTAQYASIRARAILSVPQQLVTPDIKGETDTELNRHASWAFMNKGGVDEEDEEDLALPFEATGPASEDIPMVQPHTDYVQNTATESTTSVYSGQTISTTSTAVAGPTATTLGPSVVSINSAPSAPKTTATSTSATTGTVSSVSTTITGAHPTTGEHSWYTEQPSAVTSATGPAISIPSPNGVHPHHTTTGTVNHNPAHSGVHHKLIASNPHTVPGTLVVEDSIIFDRKVAEQAIRAEEEILASAEPDPSHTPSRSPSISVSPAPSSSALPPSVTASPAPSPEREMLAGVESAVDVEEETHQGHTVDMQTGSMESGDSDFINEPRENAESEDDLDFNAFDDAKKHQLNFPQPDGMYTNLRLADGEQLSRPGSVVAHGTPGNMMGEAAIARPGLSVGDDDCVSKPDTENSSKGEELDEVAAMTFPDHPCQQRSECAQCVQSLLCVWCPGMNICVSGQESGATSRFNCHTYSYGSCDTVTINPLLPKTESKAIVYSNDDFMM